MLRKNSFKIVDLLIPSIAAQKVYRAMSTPKARKLKKFEEKALEKASKEKIKFQEFEIVIYSWGKKTDKVALLVHGWEGHAGNFGALVDILVEKGYNVISYDAPSHGSSSKGSTNMFQFAACTSHIFKIYKPHTVISHSYGSVSSIIGISENLDVKVDKWLMVTTPNDFRDRMNGFIEHFKLSNRSRNKLINIVEEESGTGIDTLNMEEYADKISNVNDIRIIHSTNDIIIPIEQARAANKALRKSKIIEIEKAGHVNILWSGKLKELVTEII